MDITRMCKEIMSTQDTYEAIKLFLVGKLKKYRWKRKSECFYHSPHITVLVVDRGNRGEIDVSSLCIFVQVCNYICAMRLII